ncbi:MAG: GNAT family N-acetyltransferase [Ignavibacteriales bacterium]|nr:GNAT family N-acetyltransferase [Ignavibacteriales bacterium]
MDNITVYKDDYCISTNREKLDVNAIHNFLSTQSYWCQNIPVETVIKSIDNSLNFGLYYEDQQIGFARIISDFSTMAYLADVYVLPEHRGKGLSKWMMQVIMSHPELHGLRRWMLLTADAHGLYKQFGWKEIANPDRYMELHNKNIYQKD